jgi:hypothetical protein
MGRNTARLERKGYPHWHPEQQQPAEALMADPYPPDGTFFERHQISSDDYQQDLHAIEGYYQDKVKHIREQDEPVQEFKRRFGITLPLDQIRGLQNLYESRALTEDGIFDDLNSRLIYENLRRQRIPIALETIRNNLPAFVDAVTENTNGAARTPKDNMGAIINSFASGAYNVERALLGNELADAQLAGDAEKEQRLRKRRTLLDNLLARSSDYQKRNLVITALELAGQSIPYTAAVAAGGLIAGGAGAFAAGSLLARGQIYNSLEAIGVNPELNSVLATAGGVMMGVIESKLGTAASYISRKTGVQTAQQALAKKITGLLSDRLHLSGIWVKAASGPLGRLFIDNAGEAAEEMAQELTDIALVELARIIQKEGIEVPPEDQDYVNRIVQAGVGGWMSAVVMGLPGLGVDAITKIVSPSTGTLSPEDAQTITALAKTTGDRQEFTEKVRQAGITGVSDEALAEIKTAAEQEREQAEARAEEEYRRTRLYGGEDQSEGPAYRDADGRLYAEHIRHTESNGVTTGTYQGGDPTKAVENTYWKITYEMDGDRAVIDRVRIAGNYENLKGEILQNFADDLNQDISWEGTTYTPQAGAAPALHIGWDTQNTAKGPAASPAAAEGAEPLTPTEQRFFDRLKKAMPQQTDLEARAVLEQFRMGADLQDVSFEEYLDRHFQAGVFSEADANTLSVAQQATGKVKGGIQFDPQTGKALLLGSTWADFSTASHEFAHALRRQLTGEYLAEAERVFGVSGGKWTRENEEAFARAYERYLETGQAPTPKLAELFKQFKAFMGRIYQLVKNQGIVTPDRQALFDRLFRDAQANREAREQAGRAPSAAAYDERLNRQIDRLNRDSRRRAEELARERGVTGGPLPEVLFQPDTRAEDAVLTDPAAGYAEKSQAAVDKAQKVYGIERLDPADRRHGPTAALLSRAMRIADPAERARVMGEIRALRDLYAGTAAEFKAPNGKPSLLVETLGEEQGSEAWYAVRTASFKEWFGDWELEAIADWLLDAEPVSSITGEEFQKSAEKDLVTQVAEFFKEIGGNVDRPGLGTVVLDREGARNSIGHKLGRKKAAAFAAVPEIIKNGKIIDHQTNWKSRGYETYVINAPILIGKEPYIGEVVLVKKAKDTKFYLHEVETQEKLRSGASVQAGTESGTPLGASKLIIGKKLDEVKGNISQVRDANGEPLAVFHGTESEGFSIFNTNERDGHAKRRQSGAFFSAVKSYASSYGNNITAVFLDIKTPFVTNEYRDISTLNDANKNKFEKNGYDGIIFHDKAEPGNRYAPPEDILFDEVAVFSPAQIKSATDNAGTYGNEDPSILFQDEEGKTADVVAIDPDLIVDENGKKIDLKNTRELVTWIRNQYQGKEVTISDDGLYLTLTRRGIEAGAKRRGEAQRQMYAGIDRLIETAVYDDFIIGDEAHPKIERQNIYYSAARIGEKLYSVTIKIDIPKNEDTPNYYKDHKITEIKIEPSLQRGISAPLYEDSPGINKVILQDEGSISKVSLAVLRGEVKPSRIEGTTLFHDEAAMAAFLRNDPGVLDLAATFDSWEDFMGYYEVFDEKQPRGLLERAAREGFYKTLWEEARRLQNQETAAETAGDTGQKTVEDFLELVNSETGLVEVVSTTQGILETAGNFKPENAEEERQFNAELRAVKNAFNHQNWQNARLQLSRNQPISPTTARFIRGQVRNNPLPYMRAWGIISGDDSWLSEEQRSRLDSGEDFEAETDASPEELRRIQQALDYDEVVKKIEDKTLQMTDPQLDTYEEELGRRQEENRKQIEKTKARLSDYDWMIERLEINIHGQEQKAAQLAADTTPEGITALGRQRRKVKELQSQLLQLRKDYVRFFQSVRAADKANFRELTRLLRLQAKTEQSLRAIGDLRQIRKREVRALMRKPDLNTVHVSEARVIQWIQSHFDNLYDVIPKFIGPKAKNLQQLFSDFTTDKEGYREKLRQRLSAGAYHRIEQIIFKNTVTREVRPYGELTKAQRHTLYRLLLENENLFKDVGFDDTEEPSYFSEAESGQILRSLEERIPPHIITKLENRLSLDRWQMADVETLAGIMADIRKEGREHYRAWRDARNQIVSDYQKRFGDIIDALLRPKDLARLAGQQSDEEEKKRAKPWNIIFSGLNARRFFRMLEGGKDGLMYDVVIGGEDRAFTEQTRHEMRRRRVVEERLKAAGIKLKELWSNTFTVAEGGVAKITRSLDELLFYRHAALNERAYNAVVFGNFATQEERTAMEWAYNAGGLPAVLEMQQRILQRYNDAMRQLDAFLAKPENEKFRAVERIIGEDYDGNYDRLKEFTAREFNVDLGREAFYIPLMRLEATGDPMEQETIREVFSSAGVVQSIGKGFTLNRIDIAPWHQKPVKAGLYKTWDQMVAKQEHLMAYAGYLREMRRIFQDRGSENLMSNIKRRFSSAATDYVTHYISELANPYPQRDYTNLETMTRLMRGHYPAAVLAFRLSSIIKQAVTSPPPFLQFISAGEYAAAAARCLSEETRNMIREKSAYMASRVIDPANEFIKQMELQTLMGKGGKLKAALSKVESMGMKGLEWIDRVCVMPGWLGAYERKRAELNRNGELEPNTIEAEAVRYADQVVRDTQPSSRQVDLAPIFKQQKNPFMQMFLQFQVPQSVIMQNLLVDAPNNFRQGRIGAALTTFAVYGLTAAAVGLLEEEEDEEKLNLKYRGIDAAMGYLESIPVAGGYISYTAEHLLRTGKVKLSQFKPFPVVDEAFKAGAAVSQEQWDQAFIRSLRALGYYSGMPVGLGGEIEKAVKGGDWTVLLGYK